jgi:hypothetical protein
MKIPFSSIRILFLSVTILLFACCGVQKHYTFVLLPDTQVYSDQFPEIFEAQTDWILQNHKKIDFVLHQGDITDYNSPKEWRVAHAAMHKLENKVPFGLATGNHDNGTNGSSDQRDLDLFNQTFPFSRISQLPGFGGAMEEGKLDNYYCFTDFGKINVLILNLEFGPRKRVVQWAQSIIDQYPEHLIIYNTHAYMYADDTRMSPDRGHHWLPEKYGLGKDPQDPVLHGEELWDQLIRRNKQSFLVLSGHVLLNGVGTLVSSNDHQEAVYQMLANFQSGVIGSEKGGNGFLRILQFYPRSERLTVRTYSPYLGVYKTTPDHEFEFNGVVFDRTQTKK